MFGLDSPVHLLLLLLVVLLLFGTGKLRNAGSDIAAAIRNFKKGLKEGDEDAKAKTVEQLKADPPADAAAKSASESRDRAP